MTPLPIESRRRARLAAVVATLILASSCEGIDEVFSDVTTGIENGAEVPVEGEPPHRDLQFGDPTVTAGSDAATEAAVGTAVLVLLPPPSTAMSGRVSLGDNAVLENFDLDGYIEVTGDNVTIRNGRVRAKSGAASWGMIEIRGTGTLIQSVELDGAGGRLQWNLGPRQSGRRLHRSQAGHPWAQ